MILALALAALNQDNKHRPSPMNRAQENPLAKSASYGDILRPLMRQHDGSSEIRSNTEEVVSSFGVSTSLAAPSATVGQLNTPDMRDTGTGKPRSSVNAVLTSNTKWALQRPACNGEYREHGRAFSFPFITKSFVERTAAVVGAVKNNGPQSPSSLSSGDDA